MESMETTKRLLATIVAVVALLVSPLAFTPMAANAVEGCSPDNPGSIDFPCEPPPCTPDNPGSPDEPCTPMPEDPVVQCDGIVTVEKIVHVPVDRVTVDTEQVARLQGVADRRAATIQRLRAKIRALR